MSNQETSTNPAVQPPPSEPDTRPKTVVLQQYAGIGDLIWHIPYFREAARQSRGGRVSVISQPSTLAHEIFSVEPWVDEVIYYEHRKRKSDRDTAARHGGLSGLWRMSQELKARRFERALFFTHRFNRALLARLACIPRRSAYGFNWLQRLFLNEGPFIKPYKGSSLEVYKNASAFAIAHGLCSAPIVPKMTVPDEAVEKMKGILAELPKPFYAFSIGTSEPAKQWGKENFVALAVALLKQGRGVLLSGGPKEESLARAIEAAVPEDFRSGITHLTNSPILESAAALGMARACVGNDTGAANIAAACNRPVFVVIGSRKLIDHDPLVHFLTAPKVADISVPDVFQLMGNSGVL